jgi:hypothetical protein
VRRSHRALISAVSASGLLVGAVIVLAEVSRPRHGLVVAAAQPSGESAVSAAQLSRDIAELARLRSKIAGSATEAADLRQRIAALEKVIAAARSRPRTGTFAPTAGAGRSSFAPPSSASSRLPSPTPSTPPVASQRLTRTSEPAPPSASSSSESSPRPRTSSPRPTGSPSRSDDDEIGSAGG